VVLEHRRGLTVIQLLPVGLERAEALALFHARNAVGAQRGLVNDPSVTHGNCGHLVLRVIRRRDQLPLQLLGLVVVVDVGVHCIKKKSV